MKKIQGFVALQKTDGHPSWTNLTSKFTWGIESGWQIPYKATKLWLGVRILLAKRKSVLYNKYCCMWGTDT